MTADLTVVVLTFNEERHIARCINSVRAFADRIVVVDSFSSDATVSLARENGAEVLQNPWKNYSVQLNWALDHIEISSKWIMRLDADEVVTPGLATELAISLSDAPQAVAGYTVNRRIYFMGKWIRHGGIYPAPMLRVWRTGYGRCEARWMDEHIVVNGCIGALRGDIEDKNLNNLTWWTNKHNQYASREAIEILLSADTQALSEGAFEMSRQAALKRWVKNHIYSRLPLGTRAAFYFCLRYFIQLGFLDGWRGLAFHFLQGFWYRFLIDAKVFELRSLMTDGGLSLADAVKREWGYEIATVDGSTKLHS